MKTSKKSKEENEEDSVNAMRRLLKALMQRPERVYLAQTRDGRIVQIPERQACRAGLLDRRRPA